jgi:hypothetical protein
MKMITIRVTDEDHALFMAVAAKEEMPLSILARRLLRGRAREHELIEPKEKPKSQPTKPQVIRVPIPTAPNAWREEILSRHKSGEALPDIAESYGVPLATVRSKLDAAKLFEAEGATIGSDDGDGDELPEYNPLDPDNPTLAEQKINADRARAQLEKLGFNV